MKKLLVFIALFLISCSSEYHKPDFLFKADFNIELVDPVDRYIKDLADEHGLRIFEKSRREMKGITQGRDAFFLAFYVKDQRMPVLTITNAGFGTSLSMDLHSNEDYPIEKTERLANQVLKDLKERFGIVMVPANIDGSYKSESIKE